MAMRTGALDAPLLQLSATDVWDVRSALTHLLILGTTGAGKSSTTLKYAAQSMLQQGFGMLFCVAKPEDAEAILGWCREAGRSGSVIHWTGRNGGFNFLAHELARTGSLNNVIDLLMGVLEMIRSSSPSSGKPSDQFWIEAPKAMLRATIPVIFAATGTVRIRDVLAFIRSAPESPEQMLDAQWQQRSAFFRLFRAAHERMQQEPIAGFDDALAEIAVDYWREDYARMDNRTASNVRVSLSTALSRFEVGLLADAFCGDSDIFPELLMSGAVLVMDFPVQTEGEDAAIAQKLFKHMAERVLLARNGMAPHLRDRPVGVVADEAQNFLHHDAEFMAQCRSSRVAVVMATQSLPTVYAKVGGDHPHDRAHYLVSQFATVVLHSCACSETAEWFSRKIGKSVQRRASYNESEGTNRSYGMSMGEGTSWNEQVRPHTFLRPPRQGFPGEAPRWEEGGSEGGGDNWGRNRGHGSNRGTSWGYSEQVDWTIEPGFFGRALKTGGPANRHRVTAVWYQAGRRFAASGGNALLVEFKQ